VVVTTSAKALYLFVPDNITKSPVKYHAASFARTEFTHTSLFFYNLRATVLNGSFAFCLPPESMNLSASLSLGGSCLSD